MGQIYGIPSPCNGVKPFINLTKESIESIWLSYNLHGESYGLDIHSFRLIFTNATYFIDSNKNITSEDLNELFTSFDTDHNGMIDALELFVTLAISSGMDVTDKINFAHTLYDVNESESISRDELTLLFNGVKNGMTKVCPTQFVLQKVDDVTIDSYVSHCLGYSSSYGLDEFQSFCMKHPIIFSWINYFSSLPIPPPVDTTPTGAILEDKFAGKKTSVSKMPIKKADRPEDEAFKVIDVAVANIEIQNEVEASVVAPSEANDESVNDGDVAVVDEAVGEVADGDVGVSEVVAVEELDEDGNPKPKPVVIPMNIPLRPWFDTADLSRPEEIPSIRSDLPQDTLDLLWVHGHSSCVRQGIQYDSLGNIVYVAASNVLVLNKNEEGVWNQRVIADHQYPITSIAFNTNRTQLITADCIESRCPSANRSDDTEYSKICVWDIATGDNVCSINVTIASGVQYVDMSKDGSLIVAVLADEVNSVLVFEVATQRMIATTSIGNDASIYDARFAGSNDIICIATSKGVEFYVNENTAFVGQGSVLSYERRCAYYQVTGAAAANVCCSSVTKFEGDDDILVGNACGQLLLFRGRNCIQLLSLHTGPINAIHYNPKNKTIVTSSSDGIIKLLKNTLPVVVNDACVERKGPKLQQIPSLEVISTVDISVNADLISKDIKSLCVHDSSEKVLISLVTGDVYEISCVAGEIVPISSDENPDTTAVDAPQAAATSNLGRDVNGGAVVTSHASGKDGDNRKTLITGLAKATGGFVSGGNDCVIRLWQAADGVPQRCIKHVVVDSGIALLATSASSVAVTFDGTVNKARLGTVQVYSLPDLRYVNDVQLSNDFKVIDLKFSPDGNTLAASLTDLNVHVCTLVDGVWTRKDFVPPAGQVNITLKIDFSADGLFIRCFDTLEVVRVIEIGPTAYGTVITAPEVLRSLQWFTNSVVCTWDVKALWGGVENAVEMTVTDRSQHLFLKGSTSGNLQVARVPASQYEPAGYVSYPVHTTGISSILFIEEGTKVVTAGTSDGVIKVWKVNYDMDEVEPEVAPAEVTSADADAEGDEQAAVIVDSDDEDEDMTDGKALLSTVSRKVHNDDKYSALSWTENAGVTRDELLAYSDGSTKSPPLHELELSWVYGYSSRFVRNGVKYNKNGGILYPAASMYIIYDKVNELQTFAQVACDQVSCVDVHVSTSVAISSHKGAGNIIATVWNTLDGSTLQRISVGTVNGASSVAFNKKGDLVAIACQDDDHTVVLYNWQTNQLRSSFKTGSKKVLCMSFSHDDRRLIAGGVAHFNVFEVKANRLLSIKTGQYGAGVYKENVLSIVSLPTNVLDTSVGGNEFILGMSDGTFGIISRGERKVSSFIPGLPKAVTALHTIVLKEASAEEPAAFKLVAGGKDGWIKVYDQEFQPIAEYDVYTKDLGLLAVGKKSGCIKSVCVDVYKRKILFGTSYGEICEITLDTGSNVNSHRGLLVTSHYRNQLHAVMAHPIRQECITVGDDKIIRAWNLETNTMFTYLELQASIKCCCFAPNGQVVACGVGVVGAPGNVTLVSFFQGKMQVIHEAKDATGQITCILFSADGTRLFAASLDGNIYIYDVLNNFALTDTLRNHTEPIMYMDIAQDGRYIYSSSATGESFLVDTYSKKVMPTSSRSDFLTEIIWAKRTNICSCDTFGIFPSHGSITDISTLSFSKDNTIVACADVYGRIKVYDYPAVKAPFSTCKQYVGHCPSGVAQVMFTKEDKYLLSIGKYDRSIFKWKIRKSVADSSIAVVATTSTPAASEGIDDASADYKKPVDTFDSSFIINDIDFTVSHNSEDSGGSLLLSSVTGNASASKAMYVGNGDVVATYSDMLVSYGKDRFTQRFLDLSLPTGHTQVCMHTSACGQYLLIGTDRGILRVYSAANTTLLSELCDDIVGGVATITMSIDGTSIACVGNDQQNTLYVYHSISGRWGQDCALRFQTLVGADRVSCISFVTVAGATSMNKSTRDFYNGLPSDHSSKQTNASVAVADCTGRLKFYTVLGRNVSAVEYRNDAVITVMAQTPFPQYIVTGNATGNVKYFSGLDCGLIESRDCVIHTIKYVGDISGVCVVGYADGVRRLKHATWSSYDIVLNGDDDYISIDTTYSSIAVGNRKGIFDSSVLVNSDIDSNMTRLLLTYSNSYILEYAIKGSSSLLLSEGYSSEVVAMAAHPTQAHTIVTAHVDRTIQVWNTSNSCKCLSAFISLPHSITSIAFVSDSILILAVTGADDGGNSTALITVTGVSIDEVAADNTQVDKLKEQILIVQQKYNNVCKTPLQSIKVSPDGKTLVGLSNNGSVYLYDITQDYSLLGVLPVYPANDKTPITAVDFSVCSRYVRLFGYDYGPDAFIPVHFFDLQPAESSSEEEVKNAEAENEEPIQYHHIESSYGKYVNSNISQLASMKSIQWSSVSSPAAPEAKGVMIANAKIVSLVAVSSTFLCASYTDGTVKLFTAPATTSDLLSSVSVASGPVYIGTTADNNYIVAVTKSHGYMMKIKVQTN